MIMMPTASDEERNYNAGDIICHENERPDGLFIVKEGLVEIFHQLATDEGVAEVSLGRIGARGMFGEMGIIDHQPRSASARALGPTRVVFISRLAFQKHLEDLPPWVSILIKTFVQRVRESNRRLVEVVEAADQGRLKIGNHEIIISHGDEDEEDKKF
jgi:CRP-like cAMP-binding protein